VLQNAGEMALMWRLPLRTSSERTLVPEIRLVIRWEPVDVSRNPTSGNNEVLRNLRNN
jgi:hypothetical protein